MTLKEIEGAIGENTLSYSKITSSDLANIMKFVNVRLLIDKSCLDYYYEIDVDELKSSSMPNDELGTLKELGWSFNSDKSKLLVYLKND